MSYSDESGGLYHLQWHTMDTATGIIDHAVLYIVINYLAVEVARYVDPRCQSDSVFSFILSRFIARTVPDPVPTDDEESADAEPTDVEDATERTPLVRSPDSKPLGGPTTARSAIVSPLFLASVLGLFIGLIKPVQRVIFGLSLERSEGNWTWQAIGSGLQILAVAFVAVDILSTGATVKAAEAYR